MSKITFKFLLYNPRTNEIGLQVLMQGMTLVDIGMAGVYKVYTSEWKGIGML